jgi:nicotinamide-nucleotide amidase
MQIEIITIGNEVLSGRTLDTNFAHIARALEEVSIQVGWHTTVGDTVERIGEALRLALGRADAVVTTGGLGPTPDDLTRKAVSTLLGRPLQLNEQVVLSIRARAARQGRKLPASVETQALVPLGATLLENPLGTAPGLLIEHHDKPVILMPGVPQEMEAILERSVVPYLRERTQQRVATFTLRTAGIYESKLQEKIGSLPQHWPGAVLAYLPAYSGVDLRVTVAGNDDAAVARVAEQAYQELRAAVASVLYAEGTTTMEEVVGSLLLERGWRIATAESCTGGLVAKRLTDVPGSSRYVERGLVTYSNESKVELLGVSRDTLAAFGAVSDAVAGQMARGAAERAGVEVGVGVTGIAGPDGGTADKPVGTVFVAVHDPAGTMVRQLKLTGTRASIRERSTQAALDMVRRRLEGLPVEPKVD